MPVSLVTGGAGFIGSHVADELLRRGHQVVVLDDLSGGRAENVPARAFLVRGSITDAARLAGLFAAYQFDYVFHLAAYAAEGLSHFVRRFNYENNLGGSVTVLNAAVNAGTVKRFVFASSIAVYGAGGTPMTEDQTPEPEDPYGVAKWAVELDLRAAHRMFGLPYTIFRPHNVYGERQNIGDRYRNVIGIFMNQALRHEPFTIFGDGSQRRAFTHVSDVAPVIAAAADTPQAAGETFNLGGDTVTTVLDLARLVAAAMGVTEPWAHTLPARVEVAEVWADHTKTARVFGVREPVSLEDGLARMAAWAHGRGPQEPSRFEGIEVRRNLPPSWA